MRHSEIPNFVHNCNNCQFLKTDIVNGTVYDWWLCKYWKGATGGDWDYFRTVLIGRYGVEPHQYWSAKLSVIDEVLSKPTPDPVFEAAGEVIAEFGINPPLREMTQEERRKFAESLDIARSVKDPVQPAMHSMTATEAMHSPMPLTEQDITVAQAFEAALLIGRHVLKWSNGVSSDEAARLRQEINTQHRIIVEAIAGRGL